MDMLGIISTRLVLEQSELLKKSSAKPMENGFGKTTVFTTDKTALILRHGTDPDNYILPHLINYPANLQALKDIGVSEIVSINSTGSLKKEIKPGMIVVPDDFLTLTPSPTIHVNRPVHIIPSLNEGIRKKLIRAALKNDFEVVQQGTYWQTQGPRLETKAEISMMTRFADIVGMTMANEAVIAQEMDIPYACACSVDNFGNGLMAEPLSMEEIISHTRKNAQRMIQLLDRYLQMFF